jgi:hypothetical protein
MRSCLFRRNDLKRDRRVQCCLQENRNLERRISESFREKLGDWPLTPLLLVELLTRQLNGNRLLDPCWLQGLEPDKDPDAGEGGGQGSAVSGSFQRFLGKMRRVGLKSKSKSRSSSRDKQFDLVSAVK